jgi:hypothetical protein
MQDFFISYNKADAAWATGIGDWLDQAGFTTILQAQDFVPGSNFVSEMHGALQAANRLIMVLSPDYLRAKFPEAEWTAAFSCDPTNEKRTLVPVRVRECQPPGLLKPIVYIDLVGLSVEQARAKLLSGIAACLSGKQRATAPTPVLPEEPRQPASVQQTVRGSKNVLVGGDFTVYERPPVQKVVLERPDGSISSAQARQVQLWIERLAEGTVGMSRERAFGMWWTRFKSRFGLEKYEALPAESLPEAEAWFWQQSAIAVRSLKSKAPDAWRHARYGAIHQAMDRLGVEKLAYYAQVAVRLKMKPFSSLKSLTKRDLDRVYAMVMRDAGSQ